MIDGTSKDDNGRVVASLADGQTAEYPFSCSLPEEVTNGFNRQMHQWILAELIERQGQEHGEIAYDSWMRSVTFCEREGCSVVVVNSQSQFFSEWLINHYRNEILAALKRREGGWNGTLKFEFGLEYYEYAYWYFPKVSPTLKGVPAQDLSVTEAVSRAKKCSGQEFDPGQPPAVLESFDDYVATGSITNGLALSACREATKPKSKAKFTSLALYGPDDSGKRLLLRAAIRAMKESASLAQQELRVFFMDTRAFQRMYSACFCTGGNGTTLVDERRLAIIKNKLSRAKVLVLTDVDKLEPGRFKGTRKQLAEAINATLSVGRVLVSLSAPPTEDNLGPELYEVISRLKPIRVEKIGRANYREVVQRFLSRHEASPSADGTQRPGCNLRREIIDWVVDRSAEDSLPVVLDRVGTLAFMQSLNGHYLGLAEAQEALRLVPNDQDLLSVFFDENRQVRKLAEQDEEVRKAMLETLCWLAGEVLGWNKERIAQSFYPTEIRGDSMVARALLRVNQMMGNSGEECKHLKLFLHGLARDVICRFSVPEEQVNRWNAILPPPLTPSRRRRRRR